ncbi:hypothetical protein O181_025309 [Austropuccinia psidii MF-1]|uniref:Uncharacterized protein n=1 Tax=Austropuccinia psidii MF-1 TaxID=1389203 RepID=A0A9Q3CHT2_9BASI|nr:hypothetical protein [Austropuccinia psidii MF-1]
MCLEKGKDLFKHFNPRSSNCHFCYVGKKPCCCPGLPAVNVRRYLWRNNDGPFRKDFPVSEAPTPDYTSGYSNFEYGEFLYQIEYLYLEIVTGSRKREVARWTNVGGPIPVDGRPIDSISEAPISRINTEGLVKRIRQITNSPPDPDSEGSHELDGEEVEVVHNSAGHQSSTSPSHPPSKIFQSQIIPHTPRDLQPILSTIPTSLPPASPSSSTTRPALAPAVRPSPIPQPRNSPIVTSQHLQPVASSGRRREELSPFPFPSTQVLQQRENWPIQVTREEPNTENEGQDAVSRLF